MLRLLTAVKGKLLISVVGTLVLSLGVSVWQLHRVNNQLANSKQDNLSYRRALDTTTRTLDELVADFNKVQTLLQSREADRLRLRKENELLQRGLQSERERSEQFNACYSTPLGDDYINRLRSQSDNSRDTDS